MCARSYPLGNMLQAQSPPRTEDRDAAVIELLRTEYSKVQH